MLAERENERETIRKCWQRAREKLLARVEGERENGRDRLSEGVRGTKNEREGGGA